MSISDNSDFKWDELIDLIKEKNVIPIIGQGLYWATNDNRKVLMYHYLAEKLANDMKLPPPEPNNHAFSQMVFHYLETNGKSQKSLKQFLIQHFSVLEPIPTGPLWKLARIKPFSIFMNTTYDNFLESTLKQIRNYPTRVLSHTFNQKKTNKIKPEIFDDLEDSKCSMVINIYGSVALNAPPSYIEKDILETVVTLQKDMEMDRNNLFFQMLKEKSLLFIGCGYDDWLFRFFIRTLANEPYRTSRDPQKWKFIGDDLNSMNRGELKSFLKAYDSAVFYYACGKGKDFVDLLFDKLKMRYPEEIIPEEEFPRTAFISFHGANREEVKRLYSNFLEDGVRLWFDEKELKPGDHNAKTIISAIDKAHAFIPLISEAAKQFQQEPGIVKYHIREWEWAYSRSVSGKNSIEIMPVKIDDTDFKYKAFDNINISHIPGGNRDGDYEKLKNRLLEIQKKK